MTTVPPPLLLLSLLILVLDRRVQAFVGHAPPTGWAPLSRGDLLSVASSSVPIDGGIVSDGESFGDTPKDDTVGSSTTEDDQQALLTSLLRIAASTGRGEYAAEIQKQLALDYIQDLEYHNPTPNPTHDSEMMEGTWELLFSDTQLFRSSPFFMAGRAVCTTKEQADQYDWFCDMHRAALAISNIVAVRQIISPTQIISEFEVKVGAIPFLNDFTPFSYSGGWPVTIEGAIVSTADITPVQNGTAWEIFMDTVEIKGSNLPLLRQVLDSDSIKLNSRDLGSFLEQNVDSYTNPKPIFETTYLTDKIRISRDQDGKVFVYEKVSNDVEPTNYSNVMSDLGIAELLEGFNDSITKFYL